MVAHKHLPTGRAILKDAGGSQHSSKRNNCIRRRAGFQDSSLALDGRAQYRIEVEGQIPPEWTDRLGDMRVAHLITEPSTSRTVLIGEVADQAALMGVLSTLYTLLLPLRLVVCLGTVDPSSH